MIIQTFVSKTAEEVPDSARHFARQARFNQYRRFWVLGFGFSPLHPQPTARLLASPCSPRMRTRIRHRTAGDRHGHAELHLSCPSIKCPCRDRRRRNRRRLRRVRVDQAWRLRCRRDRSRRPLPHRWLDLARSRRRLPEQLLPHRLEAGAVVGRDVPGRERRRRFARLLADRQSRGRDHRSPLARFAPQVRLCPLVGTRRRTCSRRAEVKQHLTLLDESTILGAIHVARDGDLLAVPFVDRLAARAGQQRRAFHRPDEGDWLRDQRSGRSRRSRPTAARLRPTRS